MPCWREDLRLSEDRREDEACERVSCGSEDEVERGE